jgi:hypothetical protein
MKKKETLFTATNHISTVHTPVLTIEVIIELYKGTNEKRTTLNNGALWWGKRICAQRTGWVEEKLLLNLEENSVFVVDNASYHNLEVD